MSAESEPSEESMNYSVLGADKGSDVEKLEKYTGEADWSYLKQHFEAGALLYVDPVLELVAVGKAIANDESETVLAWKKKGDLLQPSAPHASFWEESGTKFQALVVSPFVLIQPIN